MTAQPLHRPAPLPLGAPDAIVTLECGECHGGGFTQAYDGLLRVPCGDCGSAGSHELRIVAATPDLLALYPDMAAVGGAFVCRTGASERELWWARTLEEARTGEFWWGPLDEHGEVLAALGIGGGW